MADYMARVYAEVIRKNNVTGKTIDDVPELLRSRVRELLGEMKEAPQTLSEEANLDELARTIRARVAAGEDLRTIISALDLTDEEKWELEKNVKEG